MSRYYEATTTPDFDSTQVVTSCAESGADTLFFGEHSLPPGFFDLSSGLAGELLHRLRPDPAEVGPPEGVVGMNLAFSPDDTLLALAFEGESSPNVLIWDVATGERYGSFHGPSSVTVDVAFTPDISHVAK